MWNEVLAYGALASVATAAVITLLGILWRVHRYRTGRFRGALALLIGAVTLLTCTVAFPAFFVGGTFGGLVVSVIGESLDLRINAAAIMIGVCLGIYLCIVVPVGVAIAAFAMAAFRPRASG